MQVTSQDRGRAKKLRWSALIAAAMILSGCETLEKVFTSEPGGITAGYDEDSTIGQELIDLHKAFEAGLMSEDEYQKARRDILWRYDE